ncbi:MAG: hypothetical protein CR954_00985 [Candidatus Moraniibacteriota bacterium]|nr:MAG: hypothetical protein CR954_00985 [Candidatus Moranbacteria bacterium]
MLNSGDALMGIGIATGENRAQEAAKAAVNSPLLDLSIDGARRVLFNITGGSDITMFEVEEASNVITESVDPDARIIFGTVIDEHANKGEIQITVVATGFEDDVLEEEARQHDEQNNVSIASSPVRKNTAPMASSRKETTPMGNTGRAESSVDSMATTQKKVTINADVQSPTKNVAQDDVVVRKSNPMKPEMIINEPIGAPQQPATKRVNNIVFDESEGEDIEVPAFIRKKMKKN